MNDLAVTGTGRYVGLYGTRRGTPWGYALWSFEVFGTPATTDVALNRPVVSSSDYSSQYAAAYAVDGNTSTRWSSQLSDPQWFYVDLGQRFAINEVKLTWEAAYGADFQILVSDDTVNWTPVSTVTNGTGGVNDLAVTGTGRYVGLYGTRRGTPWGYALWSFEVFGTPATTDVALNRPVVSSSDYSSQYAAAYAVDGNTSTRWSSQLSDPQWFYVDLGQRFAINEVKLSWEAAYGADFQILVSDDTVNWTPVSTVTNGTGGVNDLAVTGTGRYVALYGTRRGTPWGYALWSFEVFGTPVP